MDATVSLRGHCSNGTWLEQLGGTVAPREIITRSATEGYTQLSGRSGGWFTSFLEVGGDCDDPWTRSGIDAGLHRTARVVGYKLQVFAFIGNATFLFEEVK